MNRTHALLALMLLAVPAACGSARRGAALPASGGHYVLTEEELQAAQDRTLYDTIQRLRPTFLRSRQVYSNSNPNPEPVHVFVDGTRAEGLNTLRLFTPQAVKEVRFYEPNDANVRFGTGHHGGLIAITLLH